MYGFVLRELSSEVCTGSHGVFWNIPEDELVGLGTHREMNDYASELNGHSLSSVCENGSQWPCEFPVSSGTKLGH